MLQLKPLPPGQNALLQRRYELLGPLGEGGMGMVYMARDRRLHNRPCVVKQLRDDFHREEDLQQAVAFFEREAGVLSQLEHPNIVQILDYFEENNSYYLVMEYVEGRDLHTVLAERGESFTEEQVLDWAAQICEVLEYLHAHDPPVIYRDLKPSNIMLDVKGKIKLVDFGIARCFEDSGEGTHVVSAGYSPPEQYWGEADSRSDIYSLGATMYFLLTGKDPIALHTSSPIKENPDISMACENIVQIATSQDPMQRYQSAKDMREEILRPLAPAKQPFKGKLVEASIIIGLLLVTALAWVAYQKIESLLHKKAEQLESNQNLNQQVLQEKALLQDKYTALLKAQQAQDLALQEVQRELSGQKKPFNPGPYAFENGPPLNQGIPSKLPARLPLSQAREIDSEKDLTDPDGTIENRPLGLGLPFWPGN